ncbi:MAG: hypothetical protein FD123_2134 [Bacteroidetes bacterium]|nr:MAG: hypothetical protein FD123_2134 [Bacteroidota bacterium]
MKRIVISLCISCAIPVWAGTGAQVDYSLQQKDELRKVPNAAFKRGEELKYRMHYGLINAGEAILTVENENKVVGGRNTLHVVGKGYSRGTFDWFFKVRDRYESYIDEEAMAPLIFIRQVDEGGFKINQKQIYDHRAGRVSSNGKMLSVPSYVQDMISSFYYARSMDYSKAKPGDIFEIPCFMDDEIWPLKMKYVGKETIKSDVGKVRCLKFRPVVQKGRVFKSEEDLTAWISDDAMHVPVRAEANILVGSIKMDLMSYSNLTGALNIVK